MKKHLTLMVSTAILVTLLAALLPADGLPMEAAQRFTFLEVEYTGSIGDSQPLSEGLFAFCAADYRMGYIDEAGKTAITPVFDYAGSFSAGLAPAAMRNCRYGYIDKTGKFAIEPQFDAAENFNEGLALVRKDGVAGFIDTTGQLVDLGLDLGLSPVGSFSDGVAWVEDVSGRQGLIDLEGRLLIDCRFAWTQEFSDGVAWASEDTGDDFSQIRMGLIDSSGNWLIEPGTYTDAQPFCEGVAWVRKTGQPGVYLIDKTGKELFSMEDGRMPSTYTNGVSVNVGGNLLAIRDLTNTIVWSSKAYRPAYYGGFQNGKILVTRKSDGRHFILCDGEYKAPEPEPPPKQEWNYVSVPPADTDYEIVLKTGSGTAFVNGEKKQIDPDNDRVKAQLINDRTMLPMRFIAENTPGWTVEWDYIENCAVLRGTDTTLLVRPEDSRAYVMHYDRHQRWYVEEYKTMDQPPVNLEDRLFLPVRAISEMMGNNIFWDPCGIVVVSSMRHTLTSQEAQALLARF